MGDDGHRAEGRALAEPNSTSRSPSLFWSLGPSWPLSEPQLPPRPSGQRYKVPNAQSVVTFAEMDAFSGLGGGGVLNARDEGTGRP